MLGKRKVKLEERGIPLASTLVYGITFENKCDAFIFLDFYFTFVK